MNLREQILSRRPPSEAVEVPEWGCTVHVHAMSARERAGWGRTVRAEKDEADDVTTSARLITRCARDADGRPIFTEADAEALAATDPVPFETVLTATLRVNRMDGKAEAETAKKSETPSGDSGPGSDSTAGTPTPTTC